MCCCTADWLQDAAAAGDASLAAAALAAVPRRGDRPENLKDFLAKKRETFLVQVKRGCIMEHDVVICCTTAVEGVNVCWFGCFSYQNE